VVRNLFLLGRVIFGGYFAYNGIKHFRHEQMMSQYATQKGVPAPHAAVKGSGALLVAGGLSVMAGLNSRQGLAAILAFLVPVTLKMHQYWEVEDPQQRMGEAVNFSKNLALVGAALMMMQIPEPWPLSADAALHEDEEMFVRLGGRDLAALPV
jgi:putative oxidoreductase